MIRLITDTGGRPVKNEDLLQYLQNIELWEGFLEILGGGDPIIVTGVEITDLGGSLYTYTAGIVYFDGELCTIESGEVSISLPRTFNKNVANINPREFFDGVTKDTATNTTLVQVGGGAFSLSLTTKRLDDFTKPSASDSDALAAVLTSVHLTPANLVTLRASDAATQAGLVVNKFVTPESLASKDGDLITSVIEITDWDMDTDPSKTIAHGLGGNWVKIREVSITLRNDSDAGTASIFPLPSATDADASNHAWINNINATNVVLERLASPNGKFDNAEFNQTGGYVRGWVIIRRIP